ncbi:hypothetical protein J3F84DRAFT_382315 [Trichoderma pleuroticola]
MGLVPSGFGLHIGVELGRKLNHSRTLEVVQTQETPALLMVVSIGNLYGFILIGSPQSAACSMPGKLTGNNWPCYIVARRSLEPLLLCGALVTREVLIRLFLGKVVCLLQPTYSMSLAIESA